MRILCTVYDPETGEYRYDYKLIFEIIGGALFFTAAWRSTSCSSGATSGVHAGAHARPTTSLPAALA